MTKLEGKLPTPSSSWEIDPGGSARRTDGRAEKTKKGRPLTGRVRAESTCSACGATGHNARNKKCPEWVAR